MRKVIVLDSLASGNAEGMANFLGKRFFVKSLMNK